MSKVGRREWLNKIDQFYNPPQQLFQAGILRLGGLIKDQFYYCPKYPEIELPQLLAEHFRGRADMFAWYSWAKGLTYEFDQVTPAETPPAPTPAAGAPANVRDPAARIRQMQAARQAQAGRRGGGKYANNAPDAIREINEALQGHKNRHLVVLFHDIEWEFPGSSPESQNLIPVVRDWPQICLGHHLIIFAASPMRKWVSGFLEGPGVIDLSISGPTPQEIKQRLIHEYLLTTDDFFDWEQLDSLAEHFADWCARSGGYRPFVVQMVDNRRNTIYNGEYLKLNQHKKGFDYHAIDVDGFEKHLETYLIGQPEAKKWAVVQLRRLQQRGLPEGQRKPIIRKLFAGPSGVGKTEIAKIISRFVFDRELLLIPGTEYQQDHEVSRLLGAPPGYVGHGQPGLLTKYLQAKPYGVIILDEFEKAAQGLQLFFMNVLDQGTTETPDGIRLDFKNTIVIATSNTGAKEIDEQPFSDQLSPERRREMYQSAIQQAYNQALLGRLDGALIFERLTEQERRQVAQLYVSLFAQNAQNKYRGASKFAVTPTETFYTQLLTRCPATMGARKVEASVASVMETVLDLYLEHGSAGAVTLDWPGLEPTADGQRIEVAL